MTVVTGWDVFEDMRDAQDEMLRLNRLRAQTLSQFGRYYDSTTKAAWMPSVDISERKDAYLVAVELPGVGMDNLEITFRDGLMTIQGERFNMHDSAEEKVHRVEHRYGPFLRSIIMPSHVMAEAIEASAQDGVLQILVPKAPEVQARRIQVHAGRKQVEPALEAEAGTSG
jgi:HSP20 family protein